MSRLCDQGGSLSKGTYPGLVAEVITRGWIVPAGHSILHPCISSALCVKQHTQYQINMLRKAVFAEDVSPA